MTFTQLTSTFVAARFPAAPPDEAGQDHKSWPAFFPSTSHQHRGDMPPSWHRRGRCTARTAQDMSRCSTRSAGSSLDVLRGSQSAIKFTELADRFGLPSAGGHRLGSRVVDHDAGEAARTPHRPSDRAKARVVSKASRRPVHPPNSNWTAVPNAPAGVTCIVEIAKAALRTAAHSRRIRRSRRVRQFRVVYVTACR